VTSREKKRPDQGEQLSVAKRERKKSPRSSGGRASSVDKLIKMFTTKRGLIFIGIILLLSVAEIYLNSSEILKIFITLLKYMLFIS